MNAPNGERRDADLGVELPPRPYPGLRPFEKAEWPVFFGRERMVDDVVARLIRHRLVVVHGDSGSGKSSLIRAGVLPRLEQESFRGGGRWRTCAAMPREAPLWNLALAVSARDNPHPDEAQAIELLRALGRRAEAATQLSGLLRRTGESVCILIDQFEELFDHARRHGPDEAQLLADFLNGLFRSRPDGLYAIVTMRSEYLGACAGFVDFAETVNETQYLLPRMKRDELLRAIREPAVLYGGEVTQALAERLIADAATSADMLPLIQHGLMRLHDGKACTPGTENLERRAWRLDIDDYPRELGLAGMLSNHADEVLRDTIANHPKPEAAKQVAERAFRALIDINADGHAIRRPQTLTQLVEVTDSDEAMVSSIIHGFRIDGVSFVRPYGERQIEPLHELVDVSHEALLRCWKTIAEIENGWLVREFRDGLAWRALLVQAEAFERDENQLLSAAAVEERGRWMSEHNPAWAERYGGGWQRVRKLIEVSAEVDKKAKLEEVRRVENERWHRERLHDVSLEKAELERKQAEEQALAAHRFQRWAIAAAMVLLVVGIGSSYWAWRATEAEELERVARQQAQDATRQIKAALESEEKAKEAAERNLIALHDQMRRTDDALRSAEEARKQTQDALDTAKRMANTLVLDLGRDQDLDGTVLRRTLARLEQIQRGLDGESPAFLYSQGITKNERATLMIDQGDLVGARKAAEQSVDLGRRLVELDPTKATWQHNLAVNLTLLGDVTTLAGDLRSALASYRESLGIRRRLVAMHPDDGRWQQGLYDSLIDLGDVQAESGDFAAALVSIRESVQVMRSLVTTDSDSSRLRRTLSTSLEKIGNLQAAVGDQRSALVSYRESLENRRALQSRDPDNAAWQRDLASTLGTIGDIQGAFGDLAAALANYREGLEIRRRLAVQDPDDPQQVQEVAATLTKIGNAQSAMGDRASALATFRESLEIANRLAKQQPDRAEWQADLAFSLYQMSTVTEGETRKAYLSEAVKIVDQLERDGKLTLQQASWPRTLRDALSAGG